jgi:hypothetical protein
MCASESWASKSETEPEIVQKIASKDVDVLISILLAWDGDAVLTLVGLGSFDLGVVIVYWKL